MSIKRGLLIVGVPVALAIAAYSSVALAAASGGDTAQGPMGGYHHFRGQAGPGGDGHDPANCPNMGGDSGSSQGTDAPQT